MGPAYTGARGQEDAGRRMLGPGLEALAAGCVAAVLTDYAYHRMMHVSWRCGPLKTLFLYHAAHHRYPTDPKTLRFGYHRRVLAPYILLLMATCWALLRPTVRDEAWALTLSALFVAPVAAYGLIYEPLHAQVHLGDGSGIFGLWPLRRVRSHHLEHHSHPPGIGPFRRARGYCLLFPFL